MKKLPISKLVLLVIATLALQEGLGFASIHNEIFPVQCVSKNFPEGIGSKIEFHPDIDNPDVLYNLGLILDKQDAGFNLPVETEYYNHYGPASDYQEDTLQFTWTGGATLGEILDRKLYWHSIQIGGLNQWKSTGFVTLMINREQRHIYKCSNI